MSGPSGPRPLPDKHGSNNPSPYNSTDVLAPPSPHFSPAVPRKGSQTSMRSQHSQQSSPQMPRGTVVVVGFGFASLIRRFREMKRVLSKAETDLILRSCSCALPAITAHVPCTGHPLLASTAAYGATARSRTFRFISKLAAAGLS